jgi:hypothetical protein
LSPCGDFEIEVSPKSMRSDTMGIDNASTPEARDRIYRVARSSVTSIINHDVGMLLMTPFF